MNPQTEMLVKGGLAAVALGIIVWRHRRRGRLDDRHAGVALWAMAIVAAAAWCNFGGFHGRSAIHHWEQFHYVLGSKYFPELGYDGLYAASLEAEREIGTGHPIQSHVRDQRTNEVVPTVIIHDHAREVRARFTTDRWASFVHDVRYFLESNDYDYLSRIRRDHGYNPTPTWTFVARFATALPTVDDSTLELFALIDPVLLLVMFAMIVRTFGSRVGCMALIVFGLGYPWRFDWVGGAILRHDWLVAIGLAACLLERRRFALAGSAIAYAIMVRVFPVAFLLGPGVLVVRAAVRRQDLRWVVRFVAGVIAGLAIGVVVGAGTGRGWSAWPEFAANLDKHHSTWLTNNVGLENVLLYDQDTLTRHDVDFRLAEPWLHWQEKMNRMQHQRRWWIRGAAGVMLTWVAAAAWRQRPSESLVVGVAAVFAVALLTCYYWSMLCLLPIGRGRWLPVAAWLAIDVGLFALHLATPSFEMIFGAMSWALLVLFLAWTGRDAWPTWRAMVTAITRRVSAP
jgi:hypothetical protein